MPPIETPMRWNLEIDRVVTTALASKARRAAVYGPAGQEVSPIPRLSKVRT